MKNIDLKLSGFLLALILFFSLSACENSWLNEDNHDYDGKYYEYDDYENGEHNVDDDGTESSLNSEPLIGRTTRNFDFESFVPEQWSFDSRLDSIEINQMLSWGFNSDTGEYYLMENFAAGKETAIFATFHQKMDWNNDDFYLTIEYNGNIIANLFPIIIDDTTLLFQPKNIADVGNWESGAYQFRLYINEIEAAGRATIFHETKPLKILMVPVRGNYSGRITSPDDSWKTSTSFTYATLPVAKENFHITIGPEIDLSDRIYDLDENDGLYEAAWAIAQLQTPFNDYDMIIGVASNNFGNESFAGLSYGELEVCLVNIEDPELPATLVHEIAHLFKIGDEYDGGHLHEPINAAPYGMEGLDFNTYHDVVASKPHVKGGEDRNLPGTGSVIYADQRAYWAAEARNIGAATSYMGVGDGNFYDMWTTSDIWNHIFTSMVGKGQNYDSAHKGKITNTYHYAINITGIIDINGDFSVTPWYAYESEAKALTAHAKSGDYGIYFYDANGELISTTYFDAPKPPMVTGIDKKITSNFNASLPVDVMVKFPENSARIVIRKGETEVHSANVPENSPLVSFTGITDYQELDNNLKLTWEASGDGDELFFEIWYCPKEGEYYNIAHNLTGRSYEIDLSNYPGTNDGYFYIYATDGVRTGEASSKRVRLPYKAPEILTGEPEINSFKVTDEICLDVVIYDMQDGLLWEDEVTWLLNDEEYLTGSFLWVWPNELTKGTHTFTCIATNSAGMTVKKDYIFHIL